MSRKCTVIGCKRKPRVGNLVSHANNKVKVWIYPNTHTIRYTYSNDSKNKVYRGSVCTKCIKSNKVKKII